MSVESFEHRVRAEAMTWLTVRTNDGQDAIRSSDLLDFTVDGEPFRLMDPQRGIRSPKGFAAALSIRTVYTPPNRGAPYEDRVGEDGLLRYKWRGENPDHLENRALRAAMQSQVPLIWFFGAGTAFYKPVFPVYLLSEEREMQQFIIDPDVTRGLVAPGSPMEDSLRRYIVRETRQRLHQPVFRAVVLRAYEGRCAVCDLGHSELLDAAHIVADSDERGIASVRNGLALCKIHHAAFDRSILGIRPDHVVEIRQDLLAEIDGPMLKYGLQEHHGRRLMRLPRSRTERPSVDLLEVSYAKFRAAS